MTAPAPRAESPTNQLHAHDATGVCRRDCPAYGSMLAEKTRGFDLSQTQNARGEWVPAIPEPLFLNFGRARCDCGQKFRNHLRFREHFAYAHILGMQP